ncbi:glycosyltransferase family 2 protein [Burkholderia sola]|uniref:glycosyltransferase family 2 protein n=1 Tax=Burkholderia sola TaxID=2843302 RepID=UPI001C0A7E3F|nr:rhamnosyltransferase [Burkholderia cenocepacia]CAG2263094.1 rhamnosyltransferase [Burkholderia cenocepacia]CAG2263199.1 rhamnosyltransferase [Burkholderia cenocepacia]CAG2263284.1 rhamnosyltransferase [Burkholderia cenocepacia]CAG2263285.1 rhamnosyltransferase [Burkholderia cenocepacia]
MSNTQNRSPNTGAVIVFFHPDAACVARANRLAESMHCVVVDNTPEVLDRRALGLTDSIEYISNGWNAGIAMAFNQGVGALIQTGCDVALLFDQDSEPPQSLLTDLPQLIVRARESGSRVALVGPAYEDRRLRGVAPFVRFGWGRLQRIPPVGDVPIDVDFLISSGSCINLECWKDVGAMDESLFIDFVDLEWCIRAKQRGYQVWGIPWLRMSHELGGEPVQVLGRRYPMHGPIRHYYQFRNVIALMKRASMPLKWKSTELVKLPFRVLIYCFFPERRGEHLAMVWRGIRDGLRGRLGPYSDSVR